MIKEGITINMNEVVNLSGASIAEQKEYNDKLFNLFANMVNKLSGIEHLYGMKRRLNSEINTLKESNLKGAVLIVTLILSVFLEVRIERIVRKLPLIGPIIENMGMLFVVICIALIVLAVYIADKKIREKKIAEKENDITKLNTQIKEEINKIKDKIKFIPPSYCYSDAMSYFSKAYIDGKVDNVKEAMVSYDEYVHRQNMEQGQIKMIQKQAEIIAGQAEIKEQMNYDTALIMLSNFVTR